MIDGYMEPMVVVAGVIIGDIGQMGDVVVVWQDDIRIVNGEVNASNDFILFLFRSVMAFTSLGSDEGGTAWHNPSYLNYDLSQSMQYTAERS